MHFDCTLGRYIGDWERTPLWLFWRPQWRRALYSDLGPLVGWEYKA